MLLDEMRIEEKMGVGRGKTENQKEKFGENEGNLRKETGVLSPRVVV